MQLDESELKTLIETENFDDLAKFTIPLVLERLECTTDKKGNVSRVTHAIINTTFYQQNIIPSDIYKRFLVYITIQELNVKFNLKLDHISYVILRNKKFQLPDGGTTFNQLMYSHSPIDVLTTTAEDQNITLLPQIKDNTITNFTSDDQTKNVIIILNIKQEMVDMRIKLAEKNINFEHLSLSLNADRVCISHCGQKINDFYLSVYLKFVEAKATFENGNLLIKCPYRECCNSDGDE